MSNYLGCGGYNGYQNSMKGGEGFPSPFFDYASTQMPQSLPTVLKLAEFVMESNPTYRSAVDRINSYFLTDIEVGSPTGKKVGDDERDKYREFLTDQLDVLSILKSLGTDFDTYGNFFCSLVVPFKRFLDCPKCYTRFAFKTVTENSNFNFSFSDFKFNAKCPKCHNSGSFLVHDEPDKSEGGIRVKRWNPHDMDILHDPYTDDCEYLWRIPEDYRSDIRNGRLHQLERASRPVIEAIKRNQIFKFNKEAIFHGKEPCLAGRVNRGWGISRLLTNFRQVWYVQVLHRYNEAIALDYVVPFRLITPEPRGGSGQAGGQTLDPLLTTNMADFSSNVRRMLAKRRKDPTSWNTLPFPVKYQALGGDATQLAPRDLMDQGMETLLNAVGTPMDMYRGTMTLQTAGTSLRLFEATHRYRVHNANCFLRWLIGQVSREMSWEPVTAKLRSVTHADDANKQMMLLQLMMGGAVSSTTGLEALGVNWKNEQRRLGEEARFQQETQAEMQEEMEQSTFGQQLIRGQVGPEGAAQGGQMQGGQQTGGDPSQGGQAAQGAPGSIVGPVTQYLQSVGPETPITMQEMLETAEGLAQQLMDPAIQATQRISELRALKQQNEALHGLVKARIEKIRSQARSVGGAQVLSSGGM